MGCLCSKATSEEGKVEQSETVERPLKDYSVQLIAPTPSLRDDFVTEVGGGGDGAEVSVRRSSRTASKANVGNNGSKNEDHQRGATLGLGASGRQTVMSRIVSMPHGAQGEQTAAGWPSWLTSVAGDAIKGWVPRRADSFEKLDKIGQGTYSSVYKARDLETGKIVALKKVRFVNMDPESVRFMAREIYILRRLDHPNVMKLEGLVTSRMSCSLYLVFEYMEHDLAGLAATRGIKFTEPQIKCYMQQLLRGLEYCHSRGVLHRDIKGSNLLLDNNGALKIGDFGLATFYEPDQNQALTSRVVTLWYRAPELLLGSTEYGVSIDLWSTGCILAEMYAGKPIMPGRTEVEQMHKIFKLCGSPSEEFWKKTKLPLATSFKPQQPYKRRIADTFKDVPPSALELIEKLLAIEPETRGSAASALSSEFFSTHPLPCDPSDLPKYRPSKEFDAKLRDEEKRRKADAIKGRGPESVRRGSRDTKAPSPEFNAQGEGQRNRKTTGHKYMSQRDTVSSFAMEPHGGARSNGYSHCSTMVHPSAVGSSLNKTAGSTNRPELRSQRSHMPQAAADLLSSSSKKKETLAGKESRTGYVPKNRIHCSGPLVPPGGNLEDMLKEHERQIQQAVRKARAR
ncbi:serine/threonine-protein kinase [Pyrus ussuriensis x Pyrus communis]|uniref:Serine/threonine-protein kinase n=1 Tax=Pyrus ussuriensis x Pyrus communis TaxID=2448454 RepID=A0A5N5HL53_9ROSA|nr:probable serine/threonine-protein kinase At1g09600 isoform X2 [Pyrus x bretschneideri]KAB2628649.1 serine/threonine-protein kinase [Pyrus ussuriensis x Pyrus communis]